MQRAPDSGDSKGSTFSREECFQRNKVLKAKREAYCFPSTGVINNESEWKNRSTRRCRVGIGSQSCSIHETGGQPTLGGGVVACT
ncbi:unnamed protein product [Musa hybrid cultivar]